MKKILKVQRSKFRHGRVKVYALVGSNSRPGTVHRVNYIRSKSHRTFICTCENFIFDKFAKNRNCDCIRTLRQTYGRYLEAVPR